MDTPPKTGPTQPQDAGFIGEHDIRLNDDGFTFTVTETITFLTVSGEVITVPADFVTDLTSIPDFAQCGAVLMVIGLLAHRYLDVGFLFGMESLPIPFGLLLIWFSGSLRPLHRYVKAAVIHDWLYTTHYGPRSHCDKIFQEALVDSKTEDWERVAIYWAVRVWGVYAWRSRSPHRVMPKDQRDQAV
jgi:hypothetical protein